MPTQQPCLSVSRITYRPRREPSSAPRATYWRMGTDMLPEAMQSPALSRTAQQDRFVTVDAAYGSVTWREPNGAEIARLPADTGLSLASVVARFGPAPDALKPGEGPDLDLLGIHLGMTFDDAERRVRAAMTNSFGFGGTNASLLFAQL